MATALLTCRVCGKQYEGCRTAKRVDDVFRWQTVACSPDCGAIYLDRIRKSRMKNNNAVVDNSSEIYEAEYLDDTEVEDDWYDEDEDGCDVM